MDWNSILTICSFGGFIITVITLALSRKDKAVKDATDNNSNSKLIEYRLDIIDNNLKDIKNDIKGLVNDVDTKINKAIETHIKEFHRTTRKKGE